MRRKRAPRISTKLARAMKRCAVKSKPCSPLTIRQTALLKNLPWKLPPKNGARATDGIIRNYCSGDAGCHRTRGSVRSRDYSSRHQARKYYGATGRLGEGVGFRTGETTGKG